jgi:hypothetical protein
MDTQVVELLGKQRLTSELLRAGLEVATPIRDRGIDLIAYADIDKRLSQFAACPIQMKAATTRSFGLARKYARVRNLLIVYIWHLDEASETVIYALTYQEALAIAETLGWTETKSWRFLHRAYSTTRPSVEIVSRLAPYRMTPDKWWPKITGLTNLTPNTALEPTVVGAVSSATRSTSQVGGGLALDR